MSEKENVITNEEELSKVSGGMIPPIYQDIAEPDQAVLPLLGSAEPGKEIRSKFIPI